MECKIKNGFRCDGQRCASCPKHAEGLEVVDYTAGKRTAEWERGDPSLTPCPIKAPSCIGIPPGEDCSCRANPGPVETGTDRRRAILKEVEACVCRDRQSSYDGAEENFDRIARLANVAIERKLKEPLDAVDVALFSACIKLGRLAFNPTHMDSLIDLAGYAVCGAGIVKSRTA